MMLYISPLLDLPYCQRCSKMKAANVRVVGGYLIAPKRREEKQGGWILLS